MSEKVVGFRFSDSYLGQFGDRGIAWEHYRIGKNKLVPVVSLEWLEAYCEEELIIPEGYIHDMVRVHDLLLAAKKESEKE